MILASKTHRRLTLVLLAGASLAACATPQPRYASWTPKGEATAPPPAAAPTTGGIYKVGEPYQVAGIWYVPRVDPNYDQTGMASWYGDQFNLQPTANGETFDMTAISAAHPTLPLPSIVEVTNLDNGRKLQVRVNDRGPFVDGRVIDLSHAAARELGFDAKGLAHVRVRYVGPADLAAAGVRYAKNDPIPDLPDTPYSAPYAAPLPKPPVAVTSAPLPAVGAPAPVSALAAAPTAAPGSVFRIQAGAFSDSANAARVAANLGETGEAIVEPIQRNGVTLYRVMVTGGTEEGAATALRNRVASLGFTDARIIRPN